jgi:hypothetical protein
MFLLSILPAQKGDKKDNIQDEIKDKSGENVKSS